jgi:steroid delta-isomerase
MADESGSAEDRSAHMKDAIAAYLARHSAGDIDGIVALFADDAKAWDPVDSDPHVGAEAVRAFFAGTHEMVESITLQATGPIRCAGNFAAFPMTAVSVIGDLTVEVDIIDVMTFDDDGKISEMKAYWSMSDSRMS